MTDRRLYGLAEIADAIDVQPGTVRAWKHRGKIPEPDADLACGPVWHERTIGPWIERTRIEGTPPDLMAGQCPGCQRDIRSRVVLHLAERTGGCGACLERSA